MRNKSVKLSKKLAAILLCAAMTCGLLGGCGSTGTSSSTSTGNATVSENTSAAENSSYGSGNGKKSETVYVTADATGKVQEITVSDWLKNQDHYTTLNDTTTLQDVIAVKGSEEFSRNGSDLVFTANGEDVYYRGSVPATTSLPVSVNITYTLDGKEISTDALEGSTGHLGVHIQYTNNTSYTATIDGKEKEIKVPFMAATVLMLSTDKAKNLTIDNGKILESGDSNIVLGYGLPGLNDSFGLDEDGVFTDTVDLEADVTDYSADMMMTFVTSEVFASSDLNEAVDFESVTRSIQDVTNSSIKDLRDMDSLEDLEDMMDDLKDSCGELNDGAGQIKDGAGELKDGSGELKDGALDLKKNYTTFDSKLALLNDSMLSASDGGAALASNMKKAAKESSTLAAGAKQVSAGVSTLNSSLTGMYKTITGTIADNEKTMAQLKQAMAAATPGSEAYMNYYAQLNQLGGANAALNEIKSQMDAASLSENLSALSSGAKQVSDGCSALNNGLNQLSAGASSLNSGLSRLSSGTKQLSEASGKIAAGTGDLYEGTVKLYDGATKLYDGTVELSDGTSQLEDAFNGNLAPLVDTARALKNAAISYTTFTSLPEGCDGNVSFVIKTE